MLMMFKIRFREPFKDGTILPERARLGEEMVVTENVLDRIRNSGGLVDILETMVPNPRKKDKAEKETAHET